MYAHKEYAEHLFRESIREHQRGALERRRPRTFGGMGARPDRDLTLLKLNLCAIELDNSMLRGVGRPGVMAGALWTVERAYRWGVRPDDRCPYYDHGVQEDEDHPLWWCEAWKSAMTPFLAEVMVLGKAIKLGALSEAPMRTTKRTHTGVHGQEQRAGTRGKMEEAMQGTQQSIPALGVKSLGGKGEHRACPDGA